MQNLKTKNNEHWSYDKLINLVDYKKGKKPSILVDSPSEGYVPYVDIEAFERGVVNRYTNEKDLTLCDVDKDILIVWDGRVGLVGKASGAVGSTLMKLTPKNINRDYLLFFLRSKFWDINSNFRGAVIPHVNPDYFWEIVVPIPSIEQQVAIVKKLGQQLPEIELNKQKIIKAKKTVARFRQSILNAAVSGKLTEDWRVNNGSNAYTDEAMPSAWIKTPIVKTLLPKGIFDGPFGSNLKTSDYTDSGVRVIRLENVGVLQLINDKKTYISNEKYQGLKKHTVYENDLIFSSFIADKVRCVVLPKMDEVVIAKADCFCLRPNEEVVDVNFLAYLLSSKQTYDALVSFTHGATRPRINTTQLRNLEILLPPLKEQKELVSKIRQYYEVANKIEKQIKKAETGVLKLTQAILAKTFRA